MQLCSGCGTRNRESARYCDQCGVQLVQAPAALPTPGAGSYTPKHLAEKVLNSRAALVGERKQVTVLFADIKGSTRLAEEVGAEAWHGILNQYFAILGNAVHRLEGTVNQYTGDGIMALFGAPIAHEDHAARACFAALEMQRELARFAGELRSRRGIELALRIGLNTGEVVVGRIGDDLRMDYTAKGLTVHLAARMEQMCKPGRINVSRYTAAQIGGDFLLRDLGEQEVKGASHPIRVYELEGEHLTSARQHRRAGPRGRPLVGRLHELELLQDAMTAVRGGAGRVIAVSGEAGIGKSRLCREFAQRCWSEGVPVHHAVCIPYSAAVPMVPVRALLRSRLALAEGAGADEVQRVVRRVFEAPNAQRSSVIPLIADFLGAGGAEAGGNVRSLMMQRIARFLPQAQRPQVLIVEDLQNADAATADFMQRLCEQMAGSGSLLLINHRADWSSPILAPFYDHVIELQPLSQAEVERMARGLLGPAAELHEVAGGIAERAQGNPFFVEEAVKALAETGHLDGSAGEYALARPIEQWPVPQSVHALIGGRIDRLPEEQKNLLQAAAIIGRRFDAALLDSFAGGGYFNANLAALAAGGFVHEAGEGGHYEFSHPLTQEVAYQSQLESSRAELHAALAEVLEEQTPTSPAATDAATTLAHHWAQAQQWHKAGRWNIEAARGFASRDIEAALQQFRLAIQHLDRADYSFEVLRQRIAARAGLIRLAQFTAIERAEVDRVYDEAWRMAEDFQDVEYGAELLFSYSGEMLHRGEADSAAQLAADAVSHAEAASAPALIERFRFSVLMTHNAAGRFEQGLRLASASSDAWLQGDIDEGNFMSRGFYGAMCTWRGRFAEAREHLEASLAWALARQRECIWQCADLVDLAGFSGQLDGAQARGELALRLAQSLGSPFYKALALRALGLALCHSRRFGDALRVLEEARPLAARGGSAYPLEAGLLAVTASAQLGLGRPESALRTADEALASARRCNMRMGELQAWMVRLRIPGTVQGFAIEGVQRMQQLIEQTGAEAFRPWWLRVHARYAAEAEGAELRAEALRLLARMGARAPVSG